MCFPQVQQPPFLFLFRHPLYSLLFIASYPSFDSPFLSFARAKKYSLSYLRSAEFSFSFPPPCLRSLLFHITSAAFRSLQMEYSLLFFWRRDRLLPFFVLRWLFRSQRRHCGLTRSLSFGVTLLFRFLRPLCQTTHVSLRKQRTQSLFFFFPFHRGQAVSTWTKNRALSSQRPTPFLSFKRVRELSSFRAMRRACRDLSLFFFSAQKISVVIAFLPTSLLINVFPHRELVSGAFPPPSFPRHDLPTGSTTFL